MKIRNLNPKVVLYYMITTLRSGLFADDLYVMALTSIDEPR